MNKINTNILKINNHLNNKFHFKINKNIIDSVQKCCKR